jgi:hypothetical protein
MNILKHIVAMLALALIPLAVFSKEKVKIKAPLLPSPEPALPIVDNEERKMFQETLVKAEMGDPSAQCEMGAIYAGGNSKLGIKSDRKLARAWYLRAAHQGYQPSYHKLSMFHAMGANFYHAHGLNQSDEISESVKWDLLHRNKENYPSLQWAFGKMSESTKAEGERRANVFRAEQAKKAPAPSGK